MKKITWFTIVLLLASLLAACATPAAAPAPTEVPAPVETTAPTEPPAAVETAAPVETAPPAGEKKIILATTTSTEDSGLLEFILPDFEQLAGVTIDVIAVGTGQAITLGEDGNADVLLVHARSREDAFMEAGHGVRREDVMYNDFVILGPESDPAGIAGMTDAAQAMAKIAEAQAAFISRGDDSGTHTKELSVWKAAGIEPTGDWYVSAGQGMGAVLTMANEQLAYTISDRATYLARTLEGIELKIVVEGDPVLFNPYGVIAVNPDKSPAIQLDLANQFIDWLISLPVQEKIASFGVEEFGASLFIPDSPAWREAHGEAATPEQPAADVALKITGLVDSEQAWSEAEVRGLPTASAEGKNNKGASDTYTGALISELLALAAPKAGATTLVFIGDDGTTVEAPLADVQACTNCLLHFRNNGGFSLFLPFLSEQLSIRGVIEIQVK